MSEFTKWVACWGNATSITDREAAIYSKNITLRYPVRMCFSGDMLRFRFSNLTGTEPINIKAYIAKSITDSDVDASTSRIITFAGTDSVEIRPGKEIESDEIPYNVNAGDTISVSIYLEDYTQMNSGTLITGPLSKGFYCYGNYAKAAILPDDYCRSTGWFYFLNTIDIHTKSENRALICYGDSITAQDWPDELALRAEREGYHNISVIRRAVSGTRILRQYDCITYAAYGLRGETRFPVEVNTSGASSIIIQHGINDIIHPVGTDVNKFRPMSDLPTVEELCDAFTKIYIEPAKKLGLKVWSGTLLPIYNWRTYAPFREELKNNFNKWLRENKLVDGCIDFDLAVRDGQHPERFAEGFDSGDHLHPSKLAYKAMAAAVPLDKI